MSKSQWINEPNQKSWIYNGYKCLIKRHETLLHLCGYVGVPESSKLYKMSYNEEMIENIDVHGGITYADFWEDENDGLWYFGFDCGHYMDIQPGLRLMLGRASVLDKEGTYKTIEYVTEECEKLAKQISDIEHAETKTDK